MDDAVERRAAARAAWPVRAFRLGEEPLGTDLAGTSATERLAMVWRITLDGMAMTGARMPEYRRAEAPGRIVPLRDA